MTKESLFAERPLDNFDLGGRGAAWNAVVDTCTELDEGAAIDFGDSGVESICNFIRQTSATGEAVFETLQCFVNRLREEGFDSVDELIDHIKFQDLRIDELHEELDRADQIAVDAMNILAGA